MRRGVRAQILQKPQHGRGALLRTRLQQQVRGSDFKELSLWKDLAYPARRGFRYHAVTCGPQHQRWNPDALKGAGLVNREHGRDALPDHCGRDTQHGTLHLGWRAVRRERPPHQWRAHPSGQ